MRMLAPTDNQGYTRLYARITQEDGAFTVSIQLLNHLDLRDFASGQTEADTIELASTMISRLANQFGILPPSISISIVMQNFKDGTLH